MKRFATILFTVIISAITAFAQRSLTGTVKDASGLPVIGASVFLNGNANVGVITDMDGRFTLQIPADIVSKDIRLDVSCIGFKTETVFVGNKTEVNVILSEDTVMLDELVFVGYGSMRRSDLTGALSSVKIDEEKAAQSSSLDQLIQGAASGVEIINNSAAPGAGVSMRVRGMTSLNGSSEPLIVVDGIIMSDAVSGAVSGDAVSETNGLMGINPQDIAGIEILKDASATAIYGADGANGVILITTKQASKDNMSVKFASGLDFCTPMRKVDVLGFDDYVSYMSERSDTYSLDILKRIYDDPASRTGLKVNPVDWQDYTMRNALNHRYFFSVSGSPSDLKYSFSFGYNKQNGVVKSTGLEQYTSHLNLDKKFNKIFSLGMKLNFSFVSSESQLNAGLDALQASNSMMSAILNSKPYTKETLEDYDHEIESDEEDYSSPNKWLKYAKCLNNEVRVTPTVYADFHIVNGLTFSSKVGGDYRSSERTQWRGREVSRSTGAVGGVSHSRKIRWNWDNTLNYVVKLRKHNINAMAGFTFGQDYSKAQNPRATNVLLEDLQIDNVNSAYNATFAYDEVRNSRASFFTRGVYNFADRYILTATYRLDGSSKFQGANRFSGFPSAAASWYISNEPWFVVPSISNLKLRFGWGRVGNSSVSSYQTLDVYASNKYGNHFSDAGYITGLYQENFSNSNLKWETTEQFNGGIDFAMFKGRLSMSADVYYKTTYDLLQSRRVPYASGYSTRWVNQGTIVNKGVDFSVEAVPVATRNFEWIVSGNISMNRNTIKSLGIDMERSEIYLEKDKPSQLRYYLGNNVAQSTYMRNPANIFIEGMPIGLFYGYRTDGIVQDGETGVPLTEGGTPRQPGQIRYVDMNGNGYIDEDDRTVIGNNNPSFTYGFRSSFKFYNVSVSLNFDGVADKQVLFANLAQLTDVTTSTGTNVLSSAFRDAWSPSNPAGRYPSLQNGISSEERAYVSDRHICDASYLRLSSVSISYSYRLPKKSKVLKRIQFGVTGNNLFLITSYPGWSPMVNSFGHSMTRMGVDVGSYPMSRNYSFDINFSF